MKTFSSFITALLLLITLAGGAWAKDKAKNSCMASCLKTNSGLFDNSNALTNFCREQCHLGTGQGACLPTADGCCVPYTGDPDCGITCWTNTTCNRQICLPSISTQPNYSYNEGLGTILRGILIEGPAAASLNIAPGYYRIREFRVWDQPAQTAITLNISKNYAELAGC